MSKIAIVLLCVAVVAVAACASAPVAPTAATPPEKTRVEDTKAAWQVEWDKAVKGAGSEGLLTIYATQSATMIRELGNAFSQRLLFS